jgi:hypothetical protein
LRERNKVQEQRNSINEHYFGGKAEVERQKVFEVYMKRNIVSGIKNLGFHARDQIKVERALVAANIKSDREAFLKKYV